MADTRVQLEVEDWIRREWMPKEFGLSFQRERLKLDTGGLFDFDAVNVDNSIVASISTSGAVTSSGKLAVGKLMKIRSDALFLMMSSGTRRLIVLSEQDMYEACIREKEAGRFLREIEFILARIPWDLTKRLKVSRKVASEEVSPRKRKSR